MARYYDIDKLKEMIEAKADTLIEGKEAFLYVAKWLDLLPTADVAPRAEVDRAKQEGYELGKRQFAREIFEDIERIALLLCKEYMDIADKESDPKEKAQFRCAQIGTIAVLIKIAELKKKYTEDDLNSTGRAERSEHE